MNTTEIQQQKIRTELAQLQAELKELRAIAEKNQAEQQSKFDRYLETLEDKRDEVGGKLEDIKDSSESALEDIKTGMKEAWDRLAIAKKAAKARYN